MFSAVKGPRVARRFESRRDGVFSRVIWVLTLLAVLLPPHRLEGRPEDPPRPSLGFFRPEERLSELNTYLASDGANHDVAGGKMWSRFLDRLGQDESQPGSLLSTNRVIDGAPRAPISDDEIPRVLLADHQRNPAAPLLGWAGMLREGVGVAANPKQACEEFLRIAKLESKNNFEQSRAAIALEEAVITRLLFADSVGTSLELRDQVAEAVSQGVKGAYYWLHLLQYFERKMGPTEWSSYGGIDGNFDGSRAGELLCISLGTTPAALKPAVDAEVPAALFNLGLLLETDDKEPDPAQARTLYSRAAAKGMPAAKRRLAVLVAEGRGGPRDLPAALAQLREAAELDGVAARILGSVLSTGEWGERNPAEGLNCLTRAVALGEWRAAFAAAWSHHFGLAGKIDEAAARSILLRAESAAGLGRQTALYEIGVAFWAGVTVQQDRAQAVRCFLKIPEPARPPLAQVRLATAYRLGVGAPVDLEKAGRYATAADRTESVEADLEMAEVLLLQKKFMDALVCFRRAADHGSAVAFSRLADCAENGIGAPAQPDLARRLREQARTFSRSSPAGS